MLKILEPSHYTQVFTSNRNRKPRINIILPEILSYRSSWYASASGTEFLDIYADLPEDEKPKSGWDRALEELEEDSETK